MMFNFVAVQLRPCASNLLYLLMLAGGGKVIVEMDRHPAVFFGDNVSCRLSGSVSTKMMCFARCGLAYLDRWLMSSARQGAPVDFFCFATPPWRCPSLFLRDDHRCAAYFVLATTKVKRR